MKRYNRRRGSAMLMVLMTMAIIIVVGTSMLYITLSSFSTSIADTNQTKAYNAAVTVSTNVKNNIDQILEIYEPSTTNPKVTLNFQNDASFEEDDPYTLINGVKVSVTLSLHETNDDKTVLVDVIGNYRNETSQVSFTIDRTITYPNNQLENTYGNAFVTNSSLGGVDKTESLTFRRIEGDISISCYEDVTDTAGNPIYESDGKTVKRKMVTRYFNPIVLEGITGSIFADGDLVIGGYDNVIKIQGNIYCDGNLTIRGVNLGANLPALFKDEYKKNADYIKYTTIGNTEILGFQVLSTAEKIVRPVGQARVGEAMYAEVNGKYIPLQVYDEVSHYTLVDLYKDSSPDGKYTFHTMNYATGSAETVTVDLTKGPEDIVNKQYFGRTMWFDEACTQPIMQYPDGGSIYCTGDIIFDRCNYGDVWTYSANKTEYKYKDLTYNNGETAAINQSYIDRDVFCLGRVIIAPENLYFVNRSTEIIDRFMKTSGYLNKTSIATQSVSTAGTVFNAIKNVFGITADNPTWTVNLNIDASGNPVLYTNDFSSNYRYYQDTYGDKSLVTQGGYKSAAGYATSMSTFLTNIAKSGSNGYKTLVNTFKSKVDTTVATLLDPNYTMAGSETVYLPEAGNYRSIKFNENSNFYIYNWQYGDLLESGNTVARKLNSNPSDATVENVKTTAGCANTATTTVGGITYDSALTVRFGNIKLNQVFTNGTINVIGIDDAFGYNYDAMLTANSIKSLGDISSDFKALTFFDIVKYVNQCESDDEVYEIIQEEYFGFDDDEDATSLYNGGGEVTLKIKDGEVVDKNNKTNSVIVLSYYVDYYLDIAYTRTNSVGWGVHNYDAEWKITDENNPVSVLYDVSKRYWEYCYCDGEFYKFNGEEGKKVNNDEIASAFGISTAEVETLKTKLATGTFKYSDNIFLNYKSDTDMRAQIVSDSTAAKEDLLYNIVNGEKVRDAAIWTPTTKTSTINSFDDDLTGKNLRNKGWYHTPTDWKSVNDSPRGYRSVVRADLAHKATTEYDRYNISLSFSDVKDYIIEEYGKKLSMVGLVSAGISGTAANSHNAIIEGYGLTVGSNFNKQNELFSINAFDGAAYEGRTYGMYLRTSFLDANPDVRQDAQIRDVFLEMIDDKFAQITVQQNTQLTEVSLRALINENKDPSVKGLQEFDSFANAEGSENPLKKISQGNSAAYGGTDAENAASPAFFPNGDGTFNGKSNIWSYVKSKTVAAWWTYLQTDMGNVDNHVRVMKFYKQGNPAYNTLMANSNFKALNTLGIDPLYVQYDDKTGEAVSGTSSFAALFATTIRTQVDYTITGNVYFNFGGENGGYDTETQGPVEFGASVQTGITFIDNIATINNSKRMNITVDTTAAGYNSKTGKNNDIYIYMNAPCITYTYDEGNGDYNLVGYDPATASGRGNFRKESNGSFTDVGVGQGDYVGRYEYVGSGKGDYVRDGGFIFNKCSFRVKGTGSVYIMLVGDTSINANAYKLSTNLKGGIGSTTADRTDAMLGTHFYSSSYTEYATTYNVVTTETSIIGDLITVTSYSTQIVATPLNTKEAGNLYVIGTANNQMVVGRGGCINGFVYLPNGSYVNRTKGFLGIVPNATSSHNQATIVAQHVAVEGSNVGNLIFQAFDITAMGNSGSANTTISFVDTNNDKAVIRWEFGTYYYN